MAFVDNHELFGEGDQVPHDVQIGRILAVELLEAQGVIPVRMPDEAAEERDNE